MKNKSLLKFFCPLACIVFIGQSYSQVESTTNYKQFPFSIGQAKDRIVPIDLDGDGLKDLVSSDQHLLSVYFQQTIDAENSSPFNFEKADLTLELPGKSVGWDIDWNTLTNKENGKKIARIVAVVDGKRIIAWPINGKQLGEKETLLDDLSGNLPLGAYPLNFVRDINDDQLNDFIVPGAEHHHLFLQNNKGQFSGDINVKSNIWVESTLTANNDLTEDVGQAVNIPEFRIRDVNGDDTKDLVSRANNVLEVFLARSDGSYPPQPSYGFDLNDVEERLGEIDYDNLDLSNLSAMARYTYDITLEDATGDNIEDLLLREGNKVVFYTGSATGMNLEKPQQVLRSSGNLVSTTLLDEDEDGLKDLWLLRVEDISLGKAFVWLALSGSINIEAFIYKNQGQRFASRPHRKKVISLTFPSIIKTIGLASDINDLSESENITRTIAATINAEKTDRDLIIMNTQGIAIHLDVLSEKLDADDLFLGIIDDIREKDEFVVDIGKILSGASVEGQSNLALVKGLEPKMQLQFEDGSTEIDVGSDLFTIDLNNDQIDDIFVLSQRDEDKLSGILFLSQ